MNIRQARKHEAADIAALLYEMLDDIARSHTATKTKAEALEMLSSYIQSEHNRYSYNQIIVAEEENKIVGVMVCYEGEQAQYLDEPIISYVREKLNDDNWQPDVETKSGDFYIDSLSVDKSYQGKGIGTALLQYALQEATNRHLALTLNVEYHNERAKQLYERMGFQSEGINYINKKPFFYMKTAG
ncbi:GNAT family N-acetyltransferase [Priestia megaterium]|nr:GNAT family N-acetyltransferase [Priestia megaterium]